MAGNQTFCTTQIRTSEDLARALSYESLHAHEGKSQSFPFSCKRLTLPHVRPFEEYGILLDLPSAANFLPLCCLLRRLRAIQLSSSHSVDGTLYTPEQVLQD